MRSLLALLVLAGCQISVGDPPAPEPAPAASVVAPAAVEPGPPEVDTLARGPWGTSLSPDTLAALVGAVDTSVTGAVSLIGRAGVFHEGEVTAQTGERWQGLYPTAAGVDVRSLAITVETVRDGVVDDADGPYTGVRVSTPFSSPVDGYGYSEDAALALVRRPTAPFPAGPVPTVFVGTWPVQSGRLALALGDARYELQIVEGPETVWMPQREVGRPDRVLLLMQDERRQPISAIVGGDAGSPALLWAGDLDGDGRLDLIMDETTHYNLSAPALFLSSAAEAGHLVRRVARHHSVGC